MNRTKILVLMAALTALFLWAGYAWGGRSGLFLAFVIAAITHLGAYRFSDKIVLRMHGAQ